MKFLKMHIIKSTELNYTQKNAELPTKVGIHLNTLWTPRSSHGNTEVWRSWEWR